MTAIFHDMMHKEMEDYADDIVVKSKTRAWHFQILEQVFERSRKYKLCMNPMKCTFRVSAGKFLGFHSHCNNEKAYNCKRAQKLPAEGLLH